jgi:hypothetical protein
VKDQIPTNRWRLKVDTVKHEPEDPTHADAKPPDPEPIDPGLPDPVDLPGHAVPEPLPEVGHGDADSLGEAFDVDDEDTTSSADEKTIHRGSHPPKPSSSRRISPALKQIFQRKREQIGLSIEKVAELAGVDKAEYMRFEATNGGARLYYDHAVVLARVLGIPPNDMPGMRQQGTKEPAFGERLNQVEKALVSGPLLTFEGKDGERYGGDIDRVLTTPGFAIRVGDDSLDRAFPRGWVLGFSTGATTKKGDVVLLRHKRSRLLALRRHAGENWAGLAPWQPSYPMSDAEWLVVGRLKVVLPAP